MHSNFADFKELYGRRHLEPNALLNNIKEDMILNRYASVLSKTTLQTIKQQQQKMQNATANDQRR